MTTDQQEQQQQQRETTVTTPGDLEVRIERIFDAPRERVWQALNDPELIPKWWGEDTTVDTMDVRPGGEWRYVARMPDGSETAFRGEYREITPPERVSRTFEWEGLPGHVLVETMDLKDLGGATRLTTTSVFDTKEDRDGMLASGMEHGVRATYRRLDALLDRLGTSGG